MHKTKITIIMAVYNRVEKIEQCISSVVNQTYDNLEYIIIDGGSTDGTVDVIKKYENKIAYWCSESDAGIYDAWNKGVSHATGDYINFIGSDDAMFDNLSIERIARYLDGKLDVLAGNIILVNEQTHFENVLNNVHVKSRNTYKGGCILTQGTFIKRTIFDKYKFDLSYKIAADYKMFLQYYYDESIKIQFIDNAIQYFSDEGVSTTNFNFVKQEDNRIYNELGLYELVDCHLAKRECVIKCKFKMFLKMIGIWDTLQRIYHLQIKGDWKKHHCNNKICRWCGRK